MALLPKAVAAGVAYVPGTAFYAHAANAHSHAHTHTDSGRTLRLSFVTLAPPDIAEGVAILGRVLREHLDGGRERAP